MKKRNGIWIYTLLAVGFLLVITNGCKKEEDNTTNGKTNAIFNPDKTYGTVKDIDGNVYKTITIGTQTWMAENLRTTHYRNGEPITNVTSIEQWSSLTSEAYCNYNNSKNVDTISTFGSLYNWYVVSDERNIAPIGWHIPSDTEWSTLISYLGIESLAGGSMKEKSTLHWLYVNVGASNESGFTALPSGLRIGDGSFNDIGSCCYFWSATEANVLGSWNCILYAGSSRVDRENWIKKSGFSIRCIKD